MRIITVVFLLNLGFFCKAQAQTAFKQKEEANRLILLDSLADLTQENDSLLRETIEMAIKLDSFDIALKQSANLINFINYQTNEREEGKKVISKTREILPLVQDKNILSKYYFEVADLYYYLGDFDASIKNYSNSYTYADPDNPRFMGLAKFGLGVVFVDKGDFGNASLALQEAIKLFREQKDTVKWIDVKNSMTILYGKNGFYQEEEKERQEIIALASKLKGYSNLSIIYYNAAASANKLNKQKARIDYFKKAILSNESSEYKTFFEPVIKFGLIAAYAENDSLEKARKMLNEIEKNKDYTKGFNESFYLDAKKKVAFAAQNYTEAINYGAAYLNLKKASNEYEEIQEAEHFLSKVYKKMGNTGKALEHFENYVTIKDSIGDIQKTRTLSYYQTLYETEKRDLQIKAQQNDIALLNTENRIKNQWLLFGGLGLISLFGFVSSRRSRNFGKKKQEMQEVFIQKTLTAQEEERTRVALELHDGVGQQLMLLTRRAGNSNDESLQSLAKDTLENVRAISRGLHPAILEKFGFTVAIQDYINAIDENSDLFFTIEIENIDAFLGEQSALHLYRIFQELLNNILKHAEATSVMIDIIKKDNLIKCVIEDNGKGFDYQQKRKFSKSLGIQSVIERCKIIHAELKINSSSEGTIVDITINNSLNINTAE